MTANESMSDRRLAQLQQYAASGNLGRCEAEELLAETKRARAALVDVTAQRDEWHRQNGLLRGERDRARAMVEQIQADRDRLNTITAAIDQQKDKLITALQADAAEQRTRAETAERELAELRERIGGDRWRVRYQLGPLTEWTEPTRHETSARDWLEAFHEHYPDQPASLWHGYETQWREVPDA